MGYNNNTGGRMREAQRGIGLVDVLSSGAAGAKSFDGYFTRQGDPIECVGWRFERYTFHYKTVI